MVSNVATHGDRGAVSTDDDVRILNDDADEGEESSSSRGSRSLRGGAANVGRSGRRSTTPGGGCGDRKDGESSSDEELGEHC